MDLNAPLGMDPPPKPRLRRVWMGCAAAIAIGLFALAVYLVNVDGGRHGAFVVAAIPPPIVEKAPTAQAPATLSRDQTTVGSVAPPARRLDPSSTGATMENGVKVVRAAPGVTGGAPANVDAQGPLIIDVSRALDGARHPGKISPSGETQPSTPLARDGAPRIAIFVEGMGLSATATRTALETMPAAVDLAFVPYGATVAVSVASAKAKGHEVLLQLPMENGRGAGLGPHTLRPGEPAAAFEDDMRWLTGQFSGYAGVANLLGAPVTANAPAMTAILRGVGARGLFYVDDSTSKRSLATSLAAGLDVSVLKADVVLDATSDENKVRANLEDLVALAKAKGSAIGMASGLPDHLGVIAKFAGDLGGRGITLVALSALAGRPVTTATTR